jgi:PAS domain S-box-containing protein
MLSSFAVILFFCLYMGLLYALAQWAERRAAVGQSLVNNPQTYSLSLAVYCTSWTFFGSVGLAASNGLLFLAIYLGPTLVIIFADGLLRKMVRLKSSHRITSIADFVSARYEKSEGLAAVVTIIALVGTVPYVALQMKAFLATFAVITAHEGETGSWIGTHVGPIMVGLMVLFTIMFGVRRLDPTERHEGMVMAVAVESLVKLVFFLAAGAFVAYVLFDGVGDILDRLAQVPGLVRVTGAEGQGNGVLTWTSYLVLSANAILFLPRQFHITVVENQSEKHIRWAMWLFPLYLFLINFFVYPIAMSGLLLGYPASQADTFVLRLPLDFGSPALALAVFIGGFSAATSMILISAMTMATMISNHLLLPMVDWIPQLGFIERHLLKARWLSVALFILMGYWFELLVGEQFHLANIGLISFAAILQLGPAMIGGLYWRGGNKNGALLGMTAGFAIWAYTQLVPVFENAGWLSPSIMDKGLLGINYLRPGELFGLYGLDPITHTVFWSLLFNVGLYILGSLWLEPSKESQSRAEAFVGALSGSSIYRSLGRHEAYSPVADKRRRIEKLYARYFGSELAMELTERDLKEVGLSGKKLASITELAELYDQVEKSLGGSIGSATAHRALTRADLFSPFEADDLTDLYAEILANMRARPEDLKRKIDFYQERESLIKAHSEELEEKISELEKQVARRRAAERQLRESEERYRMAIEYSSDGVALIQDTRMLFINRKLAEIFGYPRRRELVGRSVGVLVHDRDREKVVAIARARQAGLDAPSRYDFMGVRKDGSIVFIAVSATIVNYQGETINLVYLRDVTARRRAEEDIRNLSRRLIEGIEEERKRLASDLHDEFGQALTALHMRVESLKESLPNGADLQKGNCVKLIDTIEGLADSVRNISSDLRPDMLDHLGLVPTVEWYVEEFCGRTREVKVDFEAVGFGGRKLDAQIEIVLYRILQEALNNAAKHSGASRVSVHLTYNHPRVILLITDNGKGFVASEQNENGRRGIGLVSMRERAASVGGQIDIRSAIGKGTSIRVALPARPLPSDQDESWRWADAGRIKA